MKRFSLIPILCAVAIALGGCAALDPGGKSIFAGGTSIVAAITNPVAPVNIYQAKLVYADTLELANGYREYCYSKPYASLMIDPVAGPVCKSRRQVILKMQAADDKAYAAIKSADNFVKNNPTLDATSAIKAAIAAVTDFQNVAASTAKTITK